MRAANPIYDVVFKYLMGDMRIAKLILSKILDQEVEALNLRPTEFRKKIGLNLTVFRIDFSAKIRQADGSHRLVLIEIQKAKLPTDIMRFRKYLGGHYQDQNNVHEADNGSREKALPIICIYFLGHPLEHTMSPVIKVERSYIDAVTQEKLTTKEEFIEALTHDSYIIQIPRLRERRRNELEVLLSIFDQSQQTPDSRHFLDLDEADYPEEFQRVIRRLVKAGAEQDVCETMDLEDDILDELESLERTVLLREKALEEKNKALAESTKALTESTKALTEKNEALVESTKALAKKDEALAENAKALAKKDKALNRAVQALVASGMTEDDAKRSLGLSSQDYE